jgi:hypothetical protein
VTDSPLTAAAAPSTSRRDLLPSSALPLAYFMLAHAGLAAAFAVLAFDPHLPGAYFLHPRMVALVHLVTLAWISGSILGAFYIVAPLALAMPMPARRGDWSALAAFGLGLSGMVSHFWLGGYDGMVWSALLVLGAIAWVGARAARGLGKAPVAWAVKLHIGLAFGNMLLAGAFGGLLGIGRARGMFGLSPIAAAFAHAHLAAIGWALMMVVGIAYRLLPMILPAKAPSGRGLANSAILMEVGLAALMCGFLLNDTWLIPGGLVVTAGLVSFVRNVRGMLAHRLPRPPALPRRDWSTWQVHGALLFLAGSVMTGLVLTVMPAGPTQIALAWTYGVAGLLGGLSQMVVGMQGRLVPLYAYYRAMAAHGGAPPARAANALPSAPFAKAIFLLWALGVPWLAYGLVSSHPASIRIASIVLLAGVLTGAMYLRHLMRKALATAD